MISYLPLRHGVNPYEFNLRYSRKGWRSVDTDDPTRLANCLMRCIWSCVRFAHGYRSEENFQAANYIALDFDGDLDLNQALRIFCDCEHIIGTTRRHGKEKNGIIADRFRVLLRLSATVTASSIYRSTYRQLLQTYPEADQAVKDAARLFYPCTAVVSNTIGQPDYFCIDPCPDDGLDVRPTEDYVASYYRHHEMLPTHIIKGLSTVWPVGSRNKRVFQLACDLIKSGKTIDEIYGIVLHSATYQTNVPSERIRNEIAQTIRSSEKFVRRNKEK